MWSTLKNRMGSKPPLIKIGNRGKGVSNILFFLPSEKEFAPIAAHFIKHGSKDIQTVFVLHESGLPFYSNQVTQNMITFSDKDLNQFGLIRSEQLLDRIRSKRFDALVDLNRNLDQTLSLLALELDIPMKIGFQSPLAENLYTMVIEPSPNGFLESSYETIERLLGLA